ncbi:MAG: glutamate racemase [Cytophagales bacterium]|nr:MAG: glutamate racemase [Cytophagales bacterium]TAG56146.1 MAG: glutamate racemase [Cytophagales bacterium]
MKKKQHPIGFFDSGIGGLTVAQAVTKLLPNENIIYFGDTAHLPYGEKSTAAIQSYSIKICDFLLSQKCKIILIACNSASAAAFELVKEYVGSKALVMNVIDPVINYIESKYQNKKIGLIGTKKTILSEVYAHKIKDLNINIELKSLPTPLLAPMIEEGFFNNSISESIIANYLSNPNLENIEALILGCTHYPLIKNQIQNFYSNEIEIIDSAEIVAIELENMLKTNNLILDFENISSKKFFVSDYTNSFEASTRHFFKEMISLEFYPLWN